MITSFPSLIKNLPWFCTSVITYRSSVRNSGFSALVNLRDECTPWTVVNQWVIIKNITTRWVRFKNLFKLRRNKEFNMFDIMMFRELLIFWKIKTRKCFGGCQKKDVWIPKAQSTMLTRRSKVRAKWTISLISNPWFPSTLTTSIPLCNVCRSSPRSPLAWFV